MGFVIKYSRFFSVTMLEEDRDEPLEGFRFFPSKECLKKLSDFKLIFRPRPYGFEVFYSETPLIPISQKIRFSFGFTLSETGFFEKYGLVKTDEADTENYQPGLFFDNLNASGAIITSASSSIVAAGSGTDERVSAADTFKISRQTFKVYDSAGGTAPSSYELTHMYEPSVQQTVPAAPGNGANVLVTTINSIDLEDDYLTEPGPYLLEADVNPPAPRRMYLSNELGEESVHGVVDIYWETTQNTVADPDMGQQYQITFKTK